MDTATTAPSEASETSPDSPFHSTSPIALIDHLKERLEAVVTSLREENDKLREELRAACERLQLAEEELDRLRAERREVCEHLELLLHGLESSTTVS